MTMHDAANPIAYDRDGHGDGMEAELRRPESHVLG